MPERDKYQRPLARHYGSSHPSVTDRAFPERDNQRMNEKRLGNFFGETGIDPSRSATAKGLQVMNQHLDIEQYREKKDFWETGMEASGLSEGQVQLSRPERRTMAETPITAPDGATAARAGVMTEYSRVMEVTELAGMNARREQREAQERMDAATDTIMRVKQSFMQEHRDQVESLQEDNAIAANRGLARREATRNQRTYRTGKAGERDDAAGIGQVFDRRRGVWRRGERVDRSESAARVEAQVKQSRVADSFTAGRTPEEAAQWGAQPTQATAQDFEQPRLTARERASLPPDIRASLEDDLERTTAMVEDLMPSVTNDMGEVDGQKLMTGLMEGGVTPQAASQIGPMIRAMEQETKLTAEMSLKMRALTADVHQKERQGTSYGMSTSAVRAGHVSPRQTVEMDGMTDSEMREHVREDYIGMADPAAEEAYSERRTTDLINDLGLGFDDATAPSASISTVDEAYITDARSKMAGLYEAARSESGFLGDNLARAVLGEMDLSGLDAGGKAYIAREVVNLSREYSREQVQQRAQQSVAQKEAELAGRATAIAMDVVTGASTGSSIELINKWYETPAYKQLMNADPQTIAVAFRAFVNDEIRGRLAEDSNAMPGLDGSMARDTLERLLSGQLTGRVQEEFSAFLTATLEAGIETYNVKEAARRGDEASAIREVAMAFPNREFEGNPNVWAQELGRHVAVAVPAPGVDGFVTWEQADEYHTNLELAHRAKTHLRHNAGNPYLQLVVGDSRMLSPEQIQRLGIADLPNEAVFGGLDTRDQQVIMNEMMGMGDNDPRLRLLSITSVSPESLYREGLAERHDARLIDEMRAEAFALSSVPPTELLEAIESSMSRTGTLNKITADTAAAAGTDFASIAASIPAVSLLLKSGDPDLMQRGVLMGWAMMREAAQIRALTPVLGLHDRNARFRKEEPPPSLMNTLSGTFGASPDDDKYTISELLEVSRSGLTLRQKKDLHDEYVRYAVPLKQFLDIAKQLDTAGIVSDPSQFNENAYATVDGGSQAGVEMLKAHFNVDTFEEVLSLLPELADQLVEIEKNLSAYPFVTGLEATGGIDPHPDLTFTPPLPFREWRRNTIREYRERGRGYSSRPGGWRPSQGEVVS